MKRITRQAEELICDMAEQLTEFLVRHNREHPLLVGIHTGGIWVAQRLHTLLEIEQPLGHLNIAFYRDDFSRIGMHPRVTPSVLPYAVDDRHIILVDDVLHTGRTIRAAMNEIFDYGRPASISLAVLIDRAGHELPIHADVVGNTVHLAADEQVKLLGPEPLVLEIKRTG
jgi:pyrimidine operon attenuation protein/uracil phosphoribosyltransferase